MSDTKTPTTPALTIGIVGFGHLGQYLYQHLLQKSNAKVAWIWNRSSDKITMTKIEGADGEPTTVPESLVLKEMADMKGRPVDILVEVCHPDVLAKNIDLWLTSCRAVYIGSPTGFSAQEVLDKTLAVAAQSNTTIFCPTGAFWGVQDVAKMGARRSISALHVTMRKPAASTRMEPPLSAKVEQFLEEERLAKEKGELDSLPKSVVVFDGPVGDLCPLAPNNVNTMACAALASGPELGFRNTRGTFIIERDSDVHVIEIEVTGKVQPGFDKPLTVKTQRVNPCAVGAVTGMATYVSFFSSLVGVIDTMEREVPGGASSGLRFC